MDKRIITPQTRPSFSQQRIAAILFIARLGLWVEGVWPHLAVIVALALCGWAAGLLGVPDMVPVWIHIFLLLIWGAALGWGCMRLWRWLWRHHALPPLDQAIRMIERRQKVPHRALSTIFLDRPVGRIVPQLWYQHLERLRPALARIRMPVPCADMPARDPYALRFLPVLAMGIGLVAGGGQPLDGFARWFNPGGIFFDTASDLMLDAWITPPDYTGLPPIMLAQARKRLVPDGQRLNIPVNSVFHGRITASRHLPAMIVDNRAWSFQAAGQQAFQIEQPLTGGQQLALRRGHRIRASWPITIIPDQPPAISQLSPPTISKKQQLVLDYAAQDDYRLSAIEAEMALKEPVEGTETAPPARLSLGTINQKQASGPASLDVLAHPWAGLEVEIALHARDAIDQHAASTPATITLPERVFTNPTAKILIAERRTLTLWPRSKRVAVADRLEQLLAEDPALQARPGNVIALASLNRQLRDPDNIEAVATAQELLWMIALQLDQRQLEQKEQQLADARKALEEALKNEEISRDALAPLIDAVEQALHDLHAALVQELKERLARGESLPELPVDAEHMILDEQAISTMMNRLRDSIETASRDQARQMLQNMSQMLEQLQQSMAQSPKADPQQAALQKFFQDIETLRNSQQSLAHDIERAGNTPEQLKSLAERQQKLRQKMGDAMLDSDALVGMMPPELGMAEQAMAEATQSLEAARQARALNYSAEAEDALDKVMDALQGAEGSMGMAGPRGGKGGGVGVSRPVAPAEEGRDPLGRKVTQQGTNADQNVKVPADDASLARDILNELRRRAGSMSRPEQERSYLKRLLEQF